MFVAHCAYCRVCLDEIATTIEANARRLRDHLLGCPAALAACYPALPIFGSENALGRQFTTKAHRLGAVARVIAR